MSRHHKDPNVPIGRALSHLKHAENELVAAIRLSDDHPDVKLLEAHAFLWEAISALQDVLGKKSGAD
ncbi:MAG: hypothetical protein WA581_07955 [Candidatus Acidiferrales bacterium]